MPSLQKKLFGFLLSTFVLFCVIGTLTLLVLPLQAYAQTSESSEEKTPFTTSLKSEYTVNTGGQTSVKHTFTLRNNTPTVFVKNYGIKLSGSIDTKQVHVTQNGKPLTANVISTNDGTSIGITFPEPVVGEGKSQTITIEYPDSTVALVSGQVLEVHIPRLSDDETFQNYSVILYTPEIFGPPTHSTNTTYTTTHQQTQYITTFSNNAEKATSLYFGTTQSFDATLDYVLTNSENGVRLAQIALPPDTPWQRVHYTSLEPKPRDITTDLDGNWIATYELPSQSELKVTALVQFQLSLEPDFTVPQSKPLSLHTDAQPFWDVKDAQIVALAHTYTTPRAIHDYVVSSLDYFLPQDTQVNDSTVFPERLGGAGVLSQPDFATCQEFTDLFISIARAADIPSRRVTGYAYTQNSQLRPLSLLEDVLHAWPEYFDATELRWKPIDPTWEKTTKGVNYFDQFDLNHIVFAINGASSTTPYPAGSYKAENSKTKDVSVTFAQKVLKPTSTLETELTPVTFLGIPIPGKYTVNFINPEGTAWYGQMPEIIVPPDAMNSNPTFIQLSKHDDLQPSLQILPWQTHKLDLTVYTNEWWTTIPSTILITLKPNDGFDTPKYYAVTATPRIWLFLSHPATLAALGIGCIGLAILTGSILVSRQRQARSLRR